jgi:hypothetical protein
MKTLTALIILATLTGSALAAPPRTLSLIEEHHVKAGTSLEVGAVYTVPAGRKATVSGFFCEIRSIDSTGTSQITLVVMPDATINGKLTPTEGMNPINCINSEKYHTHQISGASLKLLPGNRMVIFFTNIGPHEVFMLLNAFIFEEDL